MNKVLVGIGWDVNQFDTGRDFDLDSAAFLLTDSGKVSKAEDFVFYGNLNHPSGAVCHLGDNLTGEGTAMMNRLRLNCQSFLQILRK